MTQPMNDKPVPASIECQNEIDKDLVRAYYGDIEAFYRVRAALAAAPAVGGEPDDPFNRKQVEAVCRAVCMVEGVDPDSDVYGDGCDPQWSRYADAVAAALAATPAVGGEAVAWQWRVNYDKGSPRENEWCSWHDTSEKYYNSICTEIANGRDRVQVRALYAAPPASPLRGVKPQAMAALKAYTQADEDGVMVNVSRQALDEAIAALTASPSRGRDELHPDTQDLVEKLSWALEDKLLRSQKKYGYTNGWLTSDWKDECQLQLMEHLEKGDPLDVVAYAAFMWARGWPTASPPEQPAADPVTERDSQHWEIHGTGLDRLIEDRNK